MTNAELIELMKQDDPNAPVRIFVNLGETLIYHIPTDSTNGEVIRTLFPDGKVHPWNEYNEIVYEWNGQKMLFSYEFWNAPFKPEGQG